MFYRQTYLADNFTLPDAGSRTFDLNVTDPVTALWIKFQATNGGTSNQANTLAQCISAIEVIDGADVLFSLDGAEALAMASFEQKAMPRQEVSEIPGDVFTLCVPIRFGRFLGDPQYALDPARFVNPQIRISWNLATITAVGATGFLTATLAVSIVAHVMEGAPAPSGFLMAKEIYSWTSAAAGTEYIDLPTDYPYRGMLLRGVLAANDWHWMFDQVRINCDGGKFVAMNQRGWDLVNQMTMIYPRFQYRHDFYTHNNVTVQPILKTYEELTATPASIDDCVLAYTNAGSGQGAIRVFTAGAADGTDRRVLANVDGYNPYGCLYLPFGQQNVPGDWFPAKTFRGVKLEIRGGVNTALMYVALVQERSY